MSVSTIKESFPGAVKTETVTNTRGTFTFKKNGNIVNCMFSNKLGSALAAGDVLCAIPAGYRPEAQMPVIGARISGSSTIIVRYWQASNNLVISDAAYANDYIQLCGTWIAVS